MPAIQQGGSGAKYRGAKIKKRKVSAPSKQTIARAQQRQYVSQGQAVKKVATPAPTPAPRPDVVVGAKRTKRRTAEEYKSQPRSTRAGRVAVAQKRAASGNATKADKVVLTVHRQRAKRAPYRLKRARAKVAEGKQSARDVAVIKDLTTKAEARKDLGALKPTTYAPKAEPARITANNQAERQRLLELEHEGKLKPPTGLDKAAQLPARAIKVGADIALERPAVLAAAAYHDPIGVPKKTAKQAYEAIKGAPAAVVEAVQHPKKVIAETAKGMEKRADESFGESVKRVRKEGGLADVADIATVVPAGGATAKMVTRARPRGVRPAMRVSGGLAKRQRASYGIVGREVQRATDKTRAKVQERRVRESEKVGGKPVPVEVREAVVRNRAAGETVEVTPVVGLARRRAQRVKGVAAPKSRTVAALKTEQGHRLGAQRRAIAGLSKPEREAFYYAAALGVRDPVRGRELLERRRDSILAERERTGRGPEGRLRKTDELKKIDKILADPQKYFTQRLGERVEQIRPDVEDIGRRDPALNDEQRENRIMSQQAETLGIHRGEREGTDLYDPDETDADYRARVSAEAEKQGLARPLYFPSEKYALEDAPDPAAFAAGGARGMARPRQYTGENFRLGMQDTSLDAFLTGGARNIKRRHNWALVTDIMGRNAIRSAPGGDGPGAPVNVLKDWAARNNVGGMRFVNPGIYNRALREADISPEDLRRMAIEEDFGAPEDMAKVADAVAQATFKPNEVPKDFADTPGWYAMPEAAADEMMAATKSSGALGRSLDIAKGKQSRALLLAGNLPWLSFQVASNTLLGAAATRGTIVPTAIKAQMFKRFKLTPEERRAWDANAGSGPSADAANNLRLGAAADNSMVNGYRAFKKLPIWHKQVKGRGPEVRQVLNPLEWFAAADRAQNSVFRDAILYDNVKRGALRDMGQSMTRAQAAQERLHHLFTLGPEERMRAMIRDHDALEEHVDALNDWLGDYTTFTHRERKSMQRFVMFYPYLRYSLKFALYTMPVKHPAMTGLLANLSQLHRDELVALMGGDENLPWNLGKVYFEDDGTVKSIDLSRANPALNALTSMTTPTQAYGILPPVIGAAFDQLNTRKLYSGKAWKVGGKPANPFMKPGEYGLGVRTTILLDDLASTLFPYRTAENLTQDGPQGDDSTLLHERETKYSNRTWKGKLINKSIEADKKFDMTAEDFISEITPILPHPTRDVEKAKESRTIDRIQARKDRERKQKKRSGTTSSFGAGGGASKSFGAGG